ncbi:LysR family transcriptional regulator [Bradyrhizobium sp. CCBAU 53421]|uniref:LysR family transcriptional regulator n=1 Tax=Bradyrhizobium sp. CCBAU 53421 TaxID=1325120 RepID=UPI00188CA524|nr:LysR family transcriptional regulator [Bradyrhizobium sp. CCBAU 53421]
MQLSERVGRRMKLRDLHVFMTVVQAGSMGKAAQRLNTGQPAVSRSIAELEHVLGVRLLDRDRQGVEPTPYGRALLDCGVTVFDGLRRGVRDLEFLADPAAGEVRIGCNPFLAAGFVSAVVDRLSRRYPRMAFHLVTEQTETLYRSLNERDVDFLIAVLRAPVANERLELEALYEDPLIVAAGVQSPWARRRRIELSELVNESWVLAPPEATISSLFDQAFLVNGLPCPRATVVAVPPEARISLVTTGRFLSVLPASVLRFFSRRAEVKILPVELPVTGIPNGIVTLKNRTLGPASQRFIQAAREVGRSFAAP